MIENLRHAGTELWLSRLIQRLNPKLVQATLVLTDGTQSAAGVPSLSPACPTLRLGLPHLKSPRLPRAAWQLASFLRRHQVDVVQVHHSDPTYLAVPVARVCGVPTIVQTKYDLGYWLQGRDLKRYRILRRWVDVTLANCWACRDAALEQERAPSDQIVVVDNGIEMDALLAVDAPRFESWGERPRVGMMANLRAVKDPLTLLAAATQLRDEGFSIEFHLAGEGELRGELEQQIDQRQLQHLFRLHGTVTNVPTFWTEMDIGVLCSLTEGMPHVLLEAMAAARPVIATRVGGHVEVITDGNNGLLIEPQQPGALADAIRRLIRRPQWAGEMGQAARASVAQRFDLAAMTSRFEAFYQSLPGRASRRSSRAMPRSFAQDVALRQSGN